jgi:hypothetical protein
MTDTLVNIRQDRDRLKPLADVRRELALSWGMVTELVREGTLPAYSVSWHAVNRDDITPETRGLRVFESELDAYIDSIKVR